jgi:hypothetical protein
MLIHRQNSYASRSKRRTLRREAENREPDKKVENKFFYYAMEMFLK